MRYILLLVTLLPLHISAQVGIGTTAPTEALDVVGNLKFSGALMPNNSAGSMNTFLKSNGSNIPSSWVQIDTTFISDFSIKIRSLFKAGPGIIFNQNTGTITNAASLKASTQVVRANPGSTNSSSVTMVGLAGSIKTLNGTQVMVVISGDIAQSGNDGNSTIQMHYGTGTAPSNGNAASGTVAGGRLNIAFQGTGSKLKYPFSTNAIISGVTPGTTYWLDLGTTNSGGHTVNIKNVSISAFEL